MSFSSSRSPDAGAPSRLDAVVALLLVCAAAAVRLLYLWGPMGHDESYTYIGFASRSLLAVLSDYSLPNNHILHTLMVWASTRLLGMQPWAVRLPAFIAGILIVPALYFLGLRIYGRWAGLLAAGFAVAHPAMVLYASIARGYSLYMLLTVLLLLLAHALLKRSPWWGWLLLGLTAALLFYTLPSGLYPVGGVFLWLLLEGLLTRDVRAAQDGWRGWMLRMALAAGAGAALTFLFYFPVLRIGTGWQSLAANPFVASLSWADFPPTLLSRLGDVQTEWTYHLPAWTGWVTWVGCLLSLLLHRRISRLTVPPQLPMLAWIALVVVLQRPNAMARVWTFLLPLWMLWGAAGWVGLIGWLRARFAWRVPLEAAAAALVLLALAGFSFQSVHRDFPAFQPAAGVTERAVRWLEGQVQPEDGVVIDPGRQPQLWYYARLIGIPESALHRLEDRAAQIPRLFIILKLGEGYTLEGLVRERGLDPAMFDLPAARLLTEIEDLQVWQVPAAQP